MTDANMLKRTFSRRRILAAGVAAAGLLTLGNAGCDPAITRRVHQIESRRLARHGVWIWQFAPDIDGPAERMIETLAAHGLSAIVKTHDGVEWMATYDRVEGAIGGPSDVATMAAIFEDRGVPFHAWAVVKGIDPVREAEMAAQVLAAGARSLTLDLERHDDFWEGTPDDAVRFGYELRLRQEFARVDVSIDPRPWKMLEIPLPEFASFCDGIRPQLYWDMFDDPHHVNAYRYFGFPPPAAGITPEFLVDTASTLLAPFDRWVLPIGFGAPAHADAWDRFMLRCRERRMHEMSVWRYGIATTQVLQALGSAPPPIL
jgi:hypothetical protein